MSKQEIHSVYETLSVEIIRIKVRMQKESEPGIIDWLSWKLHKLMEEYTAIKAVYSS